MLLLDNSAWARLDSSRLARDRRAEVATLIEQGEIAVCTPFLLEAGWSARSARHRDELLTDLLQLPRLHITAPVEDAALGAQQALASRGHHRSTSPSDLLIAACAHVHGAGVLHYDRDYDASPNSANSSSSRNGWHQPARSDRPQPPAHRTDGPTATPTRALRQRVRRSRCGVRRVHVGVQVAARAAIQAAYADISTD